MPKKKIGLQSNCFEELMAKLDEVGSTPAMKKGVEGALKASKQFINTQLNAAMQTGNLPAGGKYSTGDTKASIDTDMTVNWEGARATIDVGFKFKESGMKSIFLMYGTPKMPPVPGLKDAIYGSKTKKELGKLQTEAMNKVIKRIMEG
jgi:hypothetical protein